MMQIGIIESFRCSNLSHIHDWILFYQLKFCYFLFLTNPFDVFECLLFLLFLGEILSNGPLGMGWDGRSFLCIFVYFCVGSARVCVNCKFGKDMLLKIPLGHPLREVAASRPCDTQSAYLRNWTYTSCFFLYYTYIIHRFAINS